MRPFHAALIVVLALLAACSPRSAIETLSTSEDRAFAQGFVAAMRSGDAAALEPMFDPATSQESAPQLSRARTYYPAETGTTELIGFHIATNSINGVTSQAKDYTLVTHGGGHWTTTVIRTEARAGGPHRVTAWNVTGGGEMPEVYRQYQAMETAVPWLRGIGIAVLLGLAGLVFWLVRRSRARRAHNGTP